MLHNVAKLPARPRGVETPAEVKVVGQSGQISLGKRYAGKTLRMETHTDGTIVLTPVALVPESQLWTLMEPHRERIAAGMEWAREHAPEETDFDVLTAQAWDKAPQET